MSLPSCLDLLFTSYYQLYVDTVPVEFNSWVGNGYTLKVVSGYTLFSNEDRYAALWFKE